VSILLALEGRVVTQASVVDAARCTLLGGGVCEDSEDVKSNTFENTNSASPSHLPLKRPRFDGRHSLSGVSASPSCDNPGTTHDNKTSGIPDKESLKQRDVASKVQETDPVRTAKCSEGGRKKDNEAVVGRTTPTRRNTPRCGMRKFQKPFDHSRFRKRHIAIRLMYEGEKYMGFVTQGEGDDDTVEKHLFKALTRTRLVEDMIPGMTYSRCGRTDKGVSALGNVIAVEARSAFPVDLDVELPVDPLETIDIDKARAAASPATTIPSVDKGINEFTASDGDSGSSGSDPQADATRETDDSQVLDNGRG
ncbi:unnamed protein product, partial [Choristocarpus tenellus]